MRIEFTKSYLSDLYQGRQVRINEFRSNPKLIRAYIRTVRTIQGATDLNMLKRNKSLNLETLVGHPQGFSSVRINKKYRLIIDLVEDDLGQVNLVKLEKISNHYA